MPELKLNPLLKETAGKEKAGRAEMDQHILQPEVRQPIAEGQAIPPQEHTPPIHPQYQLPEGQDLRGEIRVDLVTPVGELAEEGGHRGQLKVVHHKPAIQTGAELKLVLEHKVREMLMKHWTHIMERNY